MVARIGVLALQGDVAEHTRALTEVGASTVPVRRPSDLRELHGLVLPGGESTTIGQLASDFGLVEPIRRQVAAGLPVWGTCSGLILLAEEVGAEQPLIGGLDVRVRRNAFGRQVESFEADLTFQCLSGGPFRAIFIRAPVVESVGPRVQILARLEEGPIVAVREGAILGTSFHPELGEDLRLHRYFVDIALRSAQATRACAT